jgi:hypothetical protein
MQRSRTVFPLILILALSVVPAPAGESSTFDGMLTHYESIRQALLNDNTEGVAESARHIQHLAQRLESEFSEEAAGVQPDRGGDLRALLPTIRGVSVLLAEAGSIADARSSFGKLSKAMARYRQMTLDPHPAVAFCSMAQEVWLQPKGEIGNPYYGQSMARCGELVSE